MSLLGLFQPIKNLVGLGSNKTTIDSYSFRLQTKVTLSLFVVLCFLANGRQYFGEPIRCKGRTGRDLSQKLVDSYCWVTGTYTQEHQAHSGVGQAHPRVGQAHPGVGVFDLEQHDKVFHVYYQWVSFFLILQAALFYFPRFIWKKFEGGRMRVAVEGMDLPEMDDEKITKRTLKLFTNLNKYQDHGFYSLLFFICELFNFANIIFQIIITDLFLGGRFIDYGHRYFQHLLSGDHDAVHPLHNVFPQVTSCSFSLHGRGGDVIEHDILCVLPLNVINEKIYLVLWVWLWLLVGVAVANMVYRATTYTSPGFRKWIFQFGVNKQLINQVCDKLGYGEWFFLRLIYKNVDEATFAKFIEFLADQEKRRMSAAGWNVSYKADTKRGRGQIGEGAVPIPAAKASTPESVAQDDGYIQDTDTNYSNMSTMEMKTSTKY